MQWILVERTAAGIDQARSFNDQQYRSWSTFTVASITNVRKTEGSTTLDLYVKLPFFVKNVDDSSAWPVTLEGQPDREYLLFPRYINFLMQPLVSNLIGRSNEDDSLFFNLLQIQMVLIKMTLPGERLRGAMKTVFYLANKAQGGHKQERVQRWRDGLL